LINANTGAYTLALAFLVLKSGRELLEKIVSLAKLVTIRERLKTQGKTVVLTNGHFDVLHVGHVDCLQRAKALGEWA